MSEQMWMIRAGAGAEYIEAFEDSGRVAIGWKEVGDLSKVRSREEVQNLLKLKYPTFKQGKVNMTAGQLYRFSRELNLNDIVLTFDSARRVYLTGRITGNYEYNPETLPEIPHSREVSWDKEIDRDAISIPTRNVLGSISTLFLIKEQNAAEIRALVNGEKPPTQIIEPESIEPDTVDDIFQDVESRSREFIQDRINALDWEDVQDLVAGILEAMGYKTQVSKPGADRGKDIVASPDGFGFEQPRILVEVKHREGKMGAPDIRSFLGGRHKDDKGLYVSTGGFSHEAKYEADRASIPLKLMAMEELVDALLEYYEKLDLETKALIPLTKVYWPK